MVFDGCEEALGGGGIVKADGYVDIEDVLLGERCPEKRGLHAETPADLLSLRWACLRAAVRLNVVAGPLDLP